MKETISKVRKALMDLQEELGDCRPPQGVELTSRQKSLLQRAQAQLNDAELNLMKLSRILVYNAPPAEVDEPTVD